MCVVTVADYKVSINGVVIPIVEFKEDQMGKTFELETLRILINSSELKPLDLHQRIQRSLCTLILEGTLEPGMRLPATRKLSQLLGVARDTVENAYVQLHRDGYIERKVGSGSYVTESLGRAVRGKSKRRGSEKGGKNDSSIDLGLSHRGESYRKTGSVADTSSVKAFITGLPETRTFPMAIWEKIQRQVTREYGEKAMLHGDPQGAEPLRKAIATYLNLERGANVAPNQILILSSTRQSLFLCAQLFSDHNKPILIEDPSYYGAKKVFEANGAPLIPVEVDEHGLKTAFLNSENTDASFVYVTPSHQYPTGVTLSLERRLELIEWAASNGKWIVEDDYDSEFHYEGLPTACVQGLDNYNRTIYLGTFSKTLFPGLRLGYMVLPSELVNIFVNARNIIDGYTPQIPQLTLAHFMADGHYNTHIRAMRKLYAGRREVMVQSLEKYMDDIVDVIRPEGGLQIPCFLKEGWSEEETITKARRHGINILGLSQLYTTEKKREGWVLGYSSLSDYEIEKSVIALSNVLRKK
jgi:GntR family transcriptional regulator/MocR family aminotransferase